MTTKAPTGLARFAKKAQTETAAPQMQLDGVQDAPDGPTAAKRQRGKGDTVALTVRLSRGDWERLHQLAVSEGDSIQGLCVDGLNLVFKSKGLPPLTK